MTMKNEELYVMRDGLNAVPEKVTYQDEKKKGIINFKMAVSRNKRDLKNHLIDLESGIEAPAKFKEYREKEQKLSKKYCRRGKDGKNVIIPVIEGREMGEKFDIIGFDDPGSEYSVQFRNLEKEYQKEIDERKKQMEKFNVHLKEKSEYKPYLIPFNIVPDDLPQKAMDGILYIIDFGSIPKESEPKSKKESNKKK